MNKTFMKQGEHIHIHEYKRMHKGKLITVISPDCIVKGCEFKVDMHTWKMMAGL